MKKIPFNSIPAARFKGGSLVEILVAMLVMSIGVVSVAFLFPISVLRTLQATQLTNSAQLKYDFDGLTGPRPEVVTGVGEWQPKHQYNVGDLVISTIGNNRYYERQTSDVSGALEPSWNYTVNNTTDDGSTQKAWKTHLARIYVVDPAGWEERTLEMNDRGLSAALSTADIRNTFGRSDLSPTILPMDSQFRIVRFRGGVARNSVSNLNPANSLIPFSVVPGGVTGPAAIASRLGSTQTCVLPDSWLVQVDSTDVGPSAPTSTSIQLQKTELVITLDVNNDSSVDLLPGNAEQVINARVTLFGADNKQSVVRQLKSITQPGAGYEQLNWVTALPTGFTPVRARVETFQPRYSWMLAVRRQLSGAIYMDLVTFYKRSFDPNNELIHPANFHTGTWPGLDGKLGTLDDVTDPTVVMQYNPALGAASPALRRGGFICDAQNNRWYRILNITEVSDALAELKTLDPNAAAGSLQNTRGARIRLEYTPPEASGIYTVGVAGAPGGVIVLPGIINVYPLQPKLPWEE